jgi:hypothetical protein
MSRKKDTRGNSLSVVPSSKVATDDMQVEKVRGEIVAGKLFQEELQQKRRDVLKWVADNGFQMAIPAMVELKEKHGQAYTYATIHAALIGGTFDGVPYDAIENLGLEEFLDGLQYCIEDRCSLRAAIKASRRVKEAQELGLDDEACNF